MKYGALPHELGTAYVDCQEMMFYQYLPIKLVGEVTPKFEERLNCFTPLVAAICCDFVGEFGLNNFVGRYVYLTVKHSYQTPGCSYNRGGYHSDGFLTDDINYIWCDAHPTVFNTTKFDLTLDDQLSLAEMEQQADESKQVIYPDNTILRLDQFNIHKVNDSDFHGMRTFAKVSFSLDKYNLVGNSRNYLLDYKWEMKQRQIMRNIPQVK